MTNTDILERIDKLINAAEQNKENVERLAKENKILREELLQEKEGFHKLRSSIYEIQGVLDILTEAKII